MRAPLETFIFSSYNGSRASTEADHRILAPGSLNQIITGTGKPRAFKGVEVRPGLQGSLYLTNAGEGYAGLGSYADTDVKGSVFRILAALFFVGNGALRYNGASLGASATSTLQLKILSSGAWSATTYQAGLSQPLAPTLASLSSLGTGFTGKLKAGTYSAKAIKIRSTTGVRSIASLQSNTIIVTESGGSGKSARITFPSIGSNGADRWGIYVSPRNFGSTGPHYFLREVAEADLGTVDGVLRSLEIEWTDGDLVNQELAPIDSFPPPAAVFGGVLGDTAFLDGCYGDTVSGVTAGAPGSTIVQSLPLRPEEYPPDFTIYPPEPPTALLRGGDGFYYRFGKTSMGVISNVGGEPALAFQLMWATQGVSYPHNAVVGTGGRVYAFTGKTLARVGADGEPETAWSNPVSDEMALLDAAKVRLGWNSNSHSLAVMHEADMWVYNESLNAWGPRIDLSAILAGDMTAAVTQENALIIAARDDGASDIKLYDYDSGDGLEMRSMTDWHFSSVDSDSLRQVEIVGRFDNTDNDVTVEIYRDEDDSAPVVTQTLEPPKTGLAKLTPVRLMVPSLSSFAVKVKQQTAGGDAGFEAVRATGFSRRIAG
jgi:hypothetical protein